MHPAPAMLLELEDLHEVAGPQSGKGGISLCQDRPRYNARERHDVEQDGLHGYHVPLTSTSACPPVHPYARAVPPLPAPAHRV
jgi:hypothetical protein